MKFSSLSVFISLPTVQFYSRFRLDLLEEIVKGLMDLIILVAHLFNEHQNYSNHAYLAFLTV